MAIVQIALLGTLILASSGQAAEPGRFTAARCAGLIDLFDRIVINRFDHRLLGIEAWQQREAVRLRREAEADCAAGQVWFGIQAIEDALWRVNVVPELLPNELPPGG